MYIYMYIYIIYIYILVALSKRMPTPIYNTFYSLNYHFVNLWSKSFFAYKIQYILNRSYHELTSCHQISRRLHLNAAC